MLRFSPIPSGAAIPMPAPRGWQSVVFSMVGLDLRGHAGSMTPETRTAESERQSFGILTYQVPMNAVPAGFSLPARLVLGVRAKV